MPAEARLKPKQRESIAYRVIEGQAALVTPEDSKLYRLNAVATRIWELSDGENTTHQIASRMCSEFEVDHATALRDVDRAVREFAGERLIQLDGPGSPSMGGDLERPALTIRNDGCDVALGAQTELARIAHEKCIPLEITLELSLRCNLACKHCYNFDRGSPYASASVADELTREEILDIIDQLAESGCLFIWFTGGEPMLHKGLEEFIRYARRRRFAVVVKTNGSLLTPESVRMLSDAGARRLDVSLYGAKPETHDEFTRRRGSYEKTVRGVRLARDAGIEIRINLCVVKSNAGEVARMIEFAEETGCSFGVNPFVTARYDGTRSPIDYQLDRATLKSLYLGPLDRILGTPQPHPGASLQCGCARGTCGITAKGVVYPCVGAPIPSGNLREKSFGEIWRDSPEFRWIRALKPADFTECQACPDRPFCGRNSGIVFTNSGKYTGSEPFTCMNASVRREIYREHESTRRTDNGKSAAAGKE